MDYCPILRATLACESSETDWTSRCFNFKDANGGSCLPIQCDFERQTYSVSGVVCQDENQIFGIGDNTYRCLRFFEACPYRISDGLVTLCSIPSCEVCNGDVCAKCNDPLVPSDDGKSCVQSTTTPPAKCDPNCKTCNNGVCQACNDPYILSTSKTCDYPSGTCTPNCKTCNNGVCEACNDPYILSTSKTCDYPSGTCTPNCKTCTNNVCSQCEDAYMITSESSLCVSKIESCVSATDDGMCTSCDGSRKPSEDGSKCAGKGIPWWVWLIIGIVGAVVVLAIIISAICCCCCSDTNLYGESKSSHSSRSSSRSSRHFDDSYSDSRSSSYSGSSSRSDSSSHSSWRSGSSSGRFY
ncbi:hypothetical protein, conserved [Angomonas deanei]|uniref:Uncharacterized protein n=1 Tax=Angomonas deanei TaxID=59799 RepID=A0A7G2CLY5_9TRYP|nr:hypothetical protein, conserved [Angomonas deanei]